MKKLVRVLKSFKYSDDGISLHALKEGEFAEIRANLIDGLVSAEYVVEATAIVQTEPEVSEPEVSEPEVSEPIQTRRTRKR